MKRTITFEQLPIEGYEINTNSPFYRSPLVKDIEKHLKEPFTYQELHAYLSKKPYYENQLEEELEWLIRSKALKEVRYS